MRHDRFKNGSICGIALNGIVYSRQETANRAYRLPEPSGCRALRRVFLFTLRGDCSTKQPRWHSRFLNLRKPQLL